MPCLAPWPIKQIKLQGRYAGFNTDDCIIFLEERGGGRKAKLLAQIKQSLSVTKRDKVFADVINAAWLDFNNSELFDPQTDAIALITGPLSASDIENVRTILEWARMSVSADELLNKVNRGNFSNKTKREKLEAFKTQLKKANKGTDLTPEQLWSFLKKYHLFPGEMRLCRPPSGARCCAS